MMHDKDTHELTSAGKALMHRVARERKIRIKKHMVYMVIGLPGTGKTTYVRHHMTDDTIAYDLDAIAAAFRLSAPHEEYNAPARRMANDLLRGFVRKAGDYASTLYVIRTAPSIEELEEINPDVVVYMTRTYVTRMMADRDGAEARIADAIRWTSEHDIEVRYRR